MKKYFFVLIIICCGVINAGLTSSKNPSTERRFLTESTPQPLSPASRNSAAASEVSLHSSTVLVPRSVLVHLLLHLSPCREVQAALAQKGFVICFTPQGKTLIFSDKNS